MASSAPAKGNRWGSLLSQAVAGVEARLDNILAENDDGSKPPAKPAATSQPAKPAGTQRSSTSRANDRLQEKLARAVAAKSGGGLSPGLGSSALSSSAAASPRQSIDAVSRVSLDSTGTGLAGDASGVRKSTDTGKRPSLDSTVTSSTKRDTPAQESATNGEDKAKPAATSETTVTRDGDNDRGATTADADAAAAATPIAAADEAETTNTPADETVSAPTSASQPQSDAPHAALDEVREARIRQLEEELREVRREHQEELLHTTEKMEALQVKVQYLSREAAEAAKTAAEAAPAGSLEKKLAEKDQQIAGLMEEGKNLAVTEQKHRAILKKLRLKISEDEKTITELKTAQSKADDELQVLRVRVRRVAELERAQDAAQKRVSQTQKELESVRAEVATRDATVADLMKQLRAAQDLAEEARVKANEEALEKERQRAQALEEQLATAQLEKTLAADRAKAQISEWKDKAERAAERARTAETEAQAEVQTMESKLEAMRMRAEEVSSGALGDSQAKLMRQVETLQSQYAVASDNWQGIEATLLARVSHLETERDEALQRESDMRKKAREAALRAKRAEEDLEEARFKLPKAQEDVGAFEAQVEAQTKRAEAAEAARDQAQADLETLKAAWAEERQQQSSSNSLAGERRSDANDRGTWLEGLPSVPGMPLSPLPPQIRGAGTSSRPETPSVPHPTRTWSSELLGFPGLLPSKQLRKVSAPSSQDDPAERLATRRASGLPPIRPLSGLMNNGGGSYNTVNSSTSSVFAGLPQVFSPGVMTDAGAGAGSLTSSSPQHQQQQHYAGSQRPATRPVSSHQAQTQQPNTPGQPTASSTATGADADDPLEGLERSASPPQALMQDMVSVSTVAAGPSVQLVERMSAAIRRLESEKVAAREELARIAKQRDEARAEVLTLLKDSEAGRAAAARVAELETDTAELQARLDTTLELLGEKSELVDELRADVQDVKDMYRDLVERTIK